MSAEIPISYDTSPKTKFGGKRLILVIIACVVVPPAFLIIFVMFVAQPVRNEGMGMAPTINNGDRIFFSKRIGKLNRGDIIVFHFPLDTQLSFVKRVVGLPGETIRIDEKGNLLINGNQVEEPYLSPAHYRHPRRIEELIIKPEHYFVMGDNRDASNDSRSWGQVPKPLIYGEYIGRYWPLN